MGTLVEESVTMGAAEWRAAAAEARIAAVVAMHGHTAPYGAASRLNAAAQYLRDARTFDGHANDIEMLGSEPNTAMVEKWDLSDEGQ